MCDHHNHQYVIPMCDTFQYIMYRSPRYFPPDSDKFILLVFDYSYYATSRDHAFSFVLMPHNETAGALVDLALDILSFYYANPVCMPRHQFLG